jgi:NADH:ubiquinone oxidoreductase subunit E
MALYPDRHSAALPALAAAQRRHGWCSPEAIEQVACVMALTPAYLTSVATFYDMFELEPVGRHSVYVCTNISCSLRGADELFAALQQAAADDPNINLRAFECLGACDIAPMVSIDHAYYGPLELADARRLVDDLAAGRDPIPELALALRPTADPNANSEGA